jgi:hypothetical protein
MICLSKPGLTHDLYAVQKEEFSVTCYICIMYVWQRPGLFIRDKHICRQRECYAHKDCDLQGSAGKISGYEFQGA